MMCEGIKMPIAIGVERNNDRARLDISTIPIHTIDDCLRGLSIPFDLEFLAC
jgi:hypothetical protein